MAEKHLKTCPTSLVIRDIQINTILRFYLTLIRMAKIKSQAIVGAGKDVEKEEHPPLLMGLQAGTTTLEISLLVPQKIGHCTT